MEGDLMKDGENYLDRISGDTITMIFTKNIPVSFIYYNINGLETEVVIGYTIKEDLKEN
ncbi:hypothetical protein Ga0061079_10733 [Apibacter mensalis]|uniref:Uncharacterized protein n=1 Tax=Apibacter mensalis TaxID=1586267 RepID=A0A0X3APY9_9FLAO|nr:hypothetical protein [Apibacter mensalis]CVK16431.1 hypothetical protein Ga0061079_10733 [Apibacter mensalis]